MFIGASKLPVPSPNKTLTILDELSAVAMSIWLSPLKSPSTALTGVPGTLMLFAGKKVPPPLFKRTLTVLSPKLAVTMSGRVSQLTSPNAIEIRQRARRRT